MPGEDAAHIAPPARCLRARPDAAAPGCRTAADGSGSADDASPAASRTGRARRAPPPARRAEPSIEISVMPPPGTLVSSAMSRRPSRFQTPVTGSSVGVRSSRPLSQSRPLIMVACHPDDRGPQRLGHRLDRGPKATIGVGLPQVGQVPRDDDGRGVRMHGADRLQRAGEVLLDVVASAQPHSPGEEMRVADVDEHVRRGLVPAEDVGSAGSCGHDISLWPHRPPHRAPVPPSSVTDDEEQDAAHHCGGAEREAAVGPRRGPATSAPRSTDSCARPSPPASQRA